MKQIILDTDFLVHCAANKIDYLEELRRICDFAFKPYIIDKTIDELNRIVANKGGKPAFYAKLAKLILVKKKVAVIKTEKDAVVDKLILDNLSKETVVATMDADLKRILRKKGIHVVVIRQKAYLVLI